MPPLVINLRKASDSRDVVHRAVQTLAEGRLVVFPTETVYGIAGAASCPKAVARIFEAKGRSEDSPLALVVKSYEDALDYAPELTGVAGRLARRCWPGPVTLVVAHGEQESLVNKFHPDVFRAVSLEGRIGLRVPAHRAIHDVLRMLAGPLVLTSANRSGQPAATTGSEAAESLAEHVALVLDDGECHYGQASTVVAADRTSWNCLREGVVPPSALERYSDMLILVVCTGNTCRSPMAEAILKTLIAAKLGCAVEELEANRVRVASAGVSAAPGCTAAAEAIEVLRSRGIDMTQHASQPLTDELMKDADLIYTLTTVHREAIVGRWPNAASRTVTLRSDGGDVSDPIGASLEVYRQCAEQIETALKERVDALTFE